MSDSKTKTAPPPQPVDMHMGVPDASARRPRWVYWLIAAVFAAWMAFLIYAYRAGRL